MVGMVGPAAAEASSAYGDGIDVTTGVNIIKKDPIRLDCDAGIGADIEIEPTIEWGSPNIEVVEAAGLNSRLLLEFDPTIAFQLHGEIDGAASCTAEITLFHLPLLPVPLLGGEIYFDHEINGTVAFTLAAMATVPFDTTVYLRPHLSVRTQGVEIDHTDLTMDVDVKAATDSDLSYELEVSPGLHYRAAFKLFSYDAVSFDAWIGPYLKMKVGGGADTCVGFYGGVRWAVLVEVLDSWGGRYKVDGDIVSERKIDDIGDCDPEPLTNRMIRAGTRIDYIDTFGVRHWVPTGQVTRCLGGAASVIQVSTELAESMPLSVVNADCTITPKIGRMIRNSTDGRIDYVDANGVRHSVLTSEVVGCLGDGRGVIELDTVTFDSIPRSTIHADCVSTRFIGRMIHSPDGRVDYVDSNGVRHWVPTPAVIGCLGDGRGLVDVDQARYESIPLSPIDADCATTRYIGHMVRNPGLEVFFVDPTGVRHLLPTPELIVCLGGVQAILDIDQATNDAIPLSPIGADCSTGEPVDDVLDIVVIGDSYAAGTGAPPFYDDSPGRITGRSDLNHAGVFRALVRANDPSQQVRLTNLAWHGATLLPDGSATDAHLIGNQLSEGTLPDTDIVFVNAGGNDARFSTLVEDCLVFATLDIDNCRASLDYAEAALPRIQAALTETLRSIRSQVDADTTIVLVGYPLLERDPRYSIYRCQTDWFIRLDLQGRTNPCDEWALLDQLGVGTRIRALGALADAMQADTVASLADPHTIFESIQATFAGHEPSAVGSGGARWVHSLFDWAVYRFNAKNLYHPNEAGYAAIGQLLYDDSRIPRADSDVGAVAPASGVGGGEVRRQAFPSK